MTDPGPGAHRAPAVRLRVDGEQLDPDRVAMLSTVRVRREASAPAACALQFEDPAGAARLEEALAVGTRVEVELEGAAGPLFTGEVVALERAFRPDGTVAVEARCQDAAHRLRADSQLRVFVDVSVADLARELAAGAGLALHAEAEGPRLPRLVQDGRTALELLTAVTRRAGLWWQADAAGTRIELFDAAGTGDRVTARYGADLLEAVVTDSAVPGRSGWRLRGWDPVTAAAASGHADTDPAVAGAQEAVRGGAITADGAHLDALARALTADDEAEGRRIRAVVEGDPALRPGTTLAVADLTPGASGDFVLLAVDHVVDRVGGYTCTVGSAPPEHLRILADAGRQALSGPAAITGAEVLRVDDPEGRGRVRVGLLAYDGIETEWLPVLALGAGEGKGLALQPAIGDRVLVAHDAQDPGRGVVLGGIRGSDGGEPGAGVVDGDVVVYGLRLPTGQSLRLAAGGDTVAIGNRTGSRIELSESGIVVHAEGDLVLEAPGRLLRLQADRIELERV